MAPNRINLYKPISRVHQGFWERLQVAIKFIWSTLLLKLNFYSVSAFEYHQLSLNQSVFMIQLKGRIIQLTLYVDERIILINF